MDVKRAPKALKETGRRFWKQVLSEYELTDAHDIERLIMAAKTLDDLQEVEARVEADGRFVVNRYGTPVEHPGCKQIRDLRTLFLKAIRELGLDLAGAPESRPPRRY